MGMMEHQEYSTLQKTVIRHEINDKEVVRHCKTIEIENFNLRFGHPYHTLDMFYFHSETTLESLWILKVHGFQIQNSLRIIGFVLYVGRVMALRKVIPTAYQK